MKENFVYLVWYFIFFMFVIIVLSIRYFDQIDRKTSVNSFYNKNSSNYKLARKYIRNLVISVIIFLVLGFFLLFFLIILENPDILNKSSPPKQVHSIPALLDLQSCGN